jgi:cation:H+ antiporter
MIKEVVLFVVGCLVLIKSAEYSVKAVSHLAKFLRLTEFVTSFILVAFVSSMPEAIISIISALQGDPSIGLGTLLGGNIADLTLILGLVTLAAHPIRVHSRIVKKDLYLGVLCMLPILLGMNGLLSRLDGIILIGAGIGFMVILVRERGHFHKPFQNHDHYLKNFLILLASVGLMISSAYVIVKSSEAMALGIGVPAILIGLVLVGLGTTLPEFIFSLQSVRKGHSEMAIGDLWGTVIVDACIGVGITALIMPIAVNLVLLSVIGIFTLFAVVFSLVFMRTDGVLSKNEAMTLILFYVAFVVAQFFMR